MAEVLSLISLISFIVAGVSFVFAVFLWFKFKIPAVIGDLSGATARKSIAKMREMNEKSGDKSYRSSSVNANRVKLTDGVGDSETLDLGGKSGETTDGRPETGLLATNKADATQTKETELLDGQGTAVLLEDENATRPLNENARKEPKRSGGKSLTMLDEVILVHTDEVIS